MITLYQFPLVWGRNVSPFALKLETWLRLAKLPYQTVAVRSPRQAPKGKIPYIDDDNGLRIGDSGQIIDHLKRTREIDPDYELDAGQRALALATTRLFDDHFAPILVHSRWLDPEGASSFLPAIFGFLPQGVRQVAGALVQRVVRRRLHSQGFGRHSQDELYAMARADLEAAATLLGARRYFFGDSPTTLDAVAYGFLGNVYLVPVETDLKRIALEFDNLRRFTEDLASGLGDRPDAAAPEAAVLEPVRTA